MAISPSTIQTPSITGDETEKFTAYSSAVHKAILVVNPAMLELLQLVNQESSVLEIHKTHKAQYICFWILFLLYLVFGLCEFIHARQRSGLAQRIVGCISHLVGALAAVVLTSVLWDALAIVLLLFWCLWLSAVAYKTFREVHVMAYLRDWFLRLSVVAYKTFYEIINMYSEANTSTADSTQLPPV